VLVTEHLIPGGKTTKLPQVVEQARPIYPFAMRLSGMRGEVVVDFIVDIEGRVRNPYVIRSLNPSFDEPAIDAVRKWRFEPGMAGDRPVPTHMQVPILFQMDMVGEGGSDGLKDLRRPDLSKLPEAFRYDTPPRIRGTVRPVYPYALLREGKEGHAVVSYVVGPKGQVVRVEVREATAPEFGQALAAAVEQFRYEPATKGGRPSLALLAFRQDFHRDEAHQLVSNLDLALLAREKKDPDSIVGLGDLDQPLVPLSRKPPHYPLIEDEFNGPAEAVVEVIVDDEGRVRLPRLVSATHPAFGEAALSGVANWRFEPPTRGGRSTQVRVRIPFSFAAAPAPAAK
jgi:TonB family protein